MSSNKQQTFNRSDIELALIKEFPSLSKSQISLAIDSILESIVDAVALDDRLRLEGLELFQKNISDLESLSILKQKKSPILERRLQCISSLLNH